MTALRQLWPTNNLWWLTIEQWLGLLYRVLVCLGIVTCSRQQALVAIDRELQ